MPRILITNDDSYLSRGLYLLYDAVRDLGEARVYSTEWPRSAVGHSVSFNKPLRLTETTHLGYSVYVTDGSPVDALHLAIAAHGFEPDLVLSGVNVGENLTIQHIVYSGTLAVAIEAALMGIPAVAFSADVHLFEEFKNQRLAEAVKTVARALAEDILAQGLPRGADLLSVNFPSPESLRGCVRITNAARRRWRPAFEQRFDTRGRPYYWLTPRPLSPEPGSDSYAVLVEGCVSITPLSIDLNPGLAPEAVARIEEMAARADRALRERLGRRDK